MKYLSTVNISHVLVKEAICPSMSKIYKGYINNTRMALTSHYPQP